MKMCWPLLLLLSFLLFVTASCRTSACRQTGVAQPIQLTDETDANQTDVEDHSKPG
jgi:hypothetical protein